MGMWGRAGRKGEGMLLLHLSPCDTLCLSYGSVRKTLSREEHCHSGGIRVDLPISMDFRPKGFPRMTVHHGIRSQITFCKTD